MSINTWDRFNVEDIPELEGLNESTATLFIELATREFVQHKIIVSTNDQLFSSIGCVTSKRSLERWLTSLYENGLLISEKYMTGPKSWRRRLFLSDKGIEAQAKLQGQIN